MHTSSRSLERRSVLGKKTERRADALMRVLAAQRYTVWLLPPPLRLSEGQISDQVDREDIWLHL